MADMVDWVNSIYEREHVIDLIRKLNKGFSSGTNIMDIILEELNNSPTNEELIVLAEFELFLTGKIFYTSDVLNLLNNILQDFELNFYHNYITIKSDILELKQKILNSRNSAPISRTNEEINNWFEEKEGLILPF